MEWPVILVLAIVVPIILIPFLLVWYINIGGVYLAMRERRAIGALATIIRALRTTFAIAIPIAIYAVAVWFSLGHFGWPVALAVALVMPVILFIPVIVWVGVVSGLFLVAREARRRRAVAYRRRAVSLAKEPV